MMASLKTIASPSSAIHVPKIEVYIFQ